MGYLLFVTLIQAFSFSLIGEYLAGHVDSYFAVLVRVVLAGLVFIPLTRWRQVEPGFMRGMLLIGALQFGITYVCLYLSFRVLTVPEVLLFTILTPLHVTLIEDALNRRFNPWALVAALVAVAGAAVIRFDSISPDFFKGLVPPSGGALPERLAPLPAVRFLLPWRAGGGAAGILVVRQGQLSARGPSAVGGAGVSGPGVHRVGALLVEQGRLPGQRRHSGGDEQFACAGGLAAQPSDLEPA